MCSPGMHLQVNSAVQAGPVSAWELPESADARIPNEVRVPLKDRLSGSHYDSGRFHILST